MDTLPGVGNYVRKSYFGERLEKTSVTADAINAWKARSQNAWVLTSDIYSSATYDMPLMRIKVSDTVPGYALFGMSAGSRVVKITDEDDITFFQTLPSSSNRDLVEGHVNADGTLTFSL